MKRFQAIVAVLLASSALTAQEKPIAGGPALPDWNVLYGQREFANAQSMFSSYLRELQEQEQALRSKVIAGLASPEAIRQYQRETRAKLRAALGELPSKTPLNARVAGILERDGYAIEKIVYESRPNYFVTANVYVPRKRSGPFPGVLAAVGHWGMGKSFEEYQQLGSFLARRGYVVLVYDAPGQGERRQYFNPVVNRALIDPGGSHWFVTLEHGYAGALTILTGGNYASYIAWDGIRGLDYLSERKDVDKTRLACTGTSGGGLQAEVLSALDERIKISIPVCYGGCNPDNPSKPGLSITDIDALIAPRPLLMIEATGDPLSSVRAKQDRHGEVAHLYRVAGQPEKSRFIVVDGPHGYVRGMQEAAYSWMQRWFFGETPDNGKLAEPVTATETAEALSYTPSGEVTMSLGGETVASLNRAHARTLAAARRQAPASGATLKDRIRTRIALDTGSALVGSQTIDRIDRGGYFVEKIVYRSERQIFVPAVLLLPKKSGRHAAAIFVNEDGKTAKGIPETYLKPLAEAGFVVLSVDPRGMGETDPSAPQSSRPSDYKKLVHDAESDYFYGALRVGKTVIGMRVRDVLAGVELLAGRPEVDAARISAIGHGMGGLIALYATAFDERIRSAAATGALASYASVVESELYTHRFGAFGPGFLRDFDLPDLAALIAPRHLILTNAVDAMHRVMDAKSMQTAYRTAADAYDRIGKREQLAILHEASTGEIARRYAAMLANAE